MRCSSIVSFSFVTSVYPQASAAGPLLSFD
jgi:hypothetical protein